ncbi:MAG: transketolase [Proteobacteria bacterium]|nr:transketolase [Pseudomonadota bacterium]
MSLPVIKRPHYHHLIAWMADKPDHIVMTADLTGSCEADGFRDTYPDRYFSMGMAEQNMISAAGAMAREGFFPYIHTFAVFLTRRVYDQVAMSVAYPNVPVRLMGFLPGITTPGGVTHQAIDDIALMRALPNMTVLTCADATQVEAVMDATEAIEGPVYIRMLRGEVVRIFPEGTAFPLDALPILRKDKGAKILLLTEGICTEYGITATQSASLQDVPLIHANVAAIKPFPEHALHNLLDGITDIVVAENHSVIGGLGSLVCECIASHGLPIRVRRLGLQDVFAHGASRAYLAHELGFDADGIENALCETVSRTACGGLDMRREAVHSDAKAEGL